MSLLDLEQSLGERLRSAMPPVQAPPDVVDRIRRRLETGTAPRARLPRWAVAAAVLLILGSGVGVSLSRREESAFVLAAPIAFADPVEAPLPAQPHWNLGFQYQLSTDLPALPQRALVYRVEFPPDRWLDQARRRLGLAMSPGDSGNPGWLGGTAASWVYNPGESPANTGPSVEPAAAQQTAIDWLKRAGLFPNGPVSITTVTASESSLVRIRPGAKSPYATTGNALGISVQVQRGKVSSAYGAWPQSLRKLSDIPLRTAAAAWADLEAGVGVSLSVDKPREIEIEHPVMTVREVKLDRALVTSLDYQRYLIPVVVFRGEVAGADGVDYPAEAYVSAIAPQPNQAHYDLAAPIPSSPAEIPPVVLRDAGFREWTPPASLETFREPDESAVKVAAARVAEAATGLGSGQLGEPIVHISSASETIDAQVPISAQGLPVTRMSGDPQPRFWVQILFSWSGEIRQVVIVDGNAVPAGAPVGLITGQEAWQRLTGGQGMVSVIGKWTYPNAQFAAHHTRITRVELAYYDSGDSREPAQPSWFFYGVAEVGEDHRQLPVLVTVPAER